MLDTAALRDMQPRPQDTAHGHEDSYVCLSGWKMPSASQNQGKPEPGTSCVGVVSGGFTMENRLVVPPELKHIISTWSSNAPVYTVLWTEVCPLPRFICCGLYPQCDCIWRVFQRQLVKNEVLRPWGLWPFKSVLALPASLPSTPPSLAAWTQRRGRGSTLWDGSRYKPREEASERHLPCPHLDHDFHH